MQLWNIKELYLALKDQLIQPITTLNLPTIDVVIDSRKVINNSIFVALKGAVNDGHNFIEEVLNQGASYAIAERIPENLNPNYIQNLILVKNSYEALNDLAKFSRFRTQAKIIAITGSVGKTSTKEMLRMVFTSQGKTFANFGNLNNHIGMPLSLANLEADCKFAIFEMGMNHLNEIIQLSKIAQPHIAIITNVGPVHIEFFTNEQEIALAKSEIFAGICSNGYAILNYDNIHFQFIKKQALQAGIKETNILKFSKNQSSDYKIKSINTTENLTSKINIEIEHSKTEVEVIINSLNPAISCNTVIAVACLDLIGNDLNSGIKALEAFSCAEGRGKILNITNNNKKITIIDDTYNASILSMKSGIENCLNLATNLNKKRIICALGDMLELGERSPEIHQELLKFVQSKNFHQVILVGNQMHEAQNIVKLNNASTYPDSKNASESIENLVNDGDILYLKGSRGIKMEKFIEKLTLKTSAH